MIALRIFLAAILFSGVAVSTTAHADDAPAQLRGKALNLTWSDSRTEKILDSGRERSLTQNSTVKVYASEEGRFFTQFARAATGGRQVNATERKEVSGGDRNILTWQVEGATLTADQKFMRGARRLIVTFDSGYTSCSLRVLHGKEAGSAAIEYETFNSQQHVQLVAINVTSANCSMSTGNPFAQ